MPAKRLILRFRDFFPGVDSIAAHNDICQSKGSVLWGWWRKEHEPDRLPELMDLDFSSPLPVLLLDRFNKTAFSCSCVEVLPSATRNTGFVPKYYRSMAKGVHAWFRFSCPITPCDYDLELAESMGEHTLRVEHERNDLVVSDYVLVTESEAKGVEERTAERYDVAVVGSPLPCSVRVVHISDLHFFPADHNFAFPGVSGVDSAQVSLAQAIHTDFSRNFEGGVDALVVSGDITSKAKWDEPLLGQIVAELSNLASLLEVEREDIVVCPGNHDFDRPAPDKRTDAAEIVLRDAMSFPHERDFRFFRNQLLGIPVDKPLATVFIKECQDFSLRLGVLNSANLARTEFVEYGFVGDPLNGVLSEMRGASSKPSYKSLVLHHHLVPISPIEEPKHVGVSVTLDAHSILSRAQQEGVQLVLHGHQHIAKIVKTAQAWQVKGKWQGLEEDIYILASGSAGSRWLGGGIANTYSVLDFSNSGVQVTCRRLDRFGGVGSEEFSIALPIKPRAG